MRSSASGVNEGNAKWNAEQERLCLERFLVQFEERGYSDKFEFLGGRTSSKGKARLRCRICGHEFEKFGNFCQQWTNIRCDMCHIHLLDETDAPRDGKLAEHLAERFLSGDLIGEISRDWNIHRRYVSNLIRDVGVVPEDEYEKRRANLQRNLEGRVNGTIKQRLVYYGSSELPFDDIDVRELYSRDGGICHICGNVTDWGDCRYTDSGRFVCGKTYPTIDHVKPLAKGGSHTWGNVKLACFLCNCRKGSRFEKAR